MLGKNVVRSGDSGYSETDERQTRCAEQDYLISTESALGVELQTRLDAGEDRVGKCLRVSTDLITPPTITTTTGDDDGTSDKARRTGSSCQALRHAVAALNRLDDFTSEKIGSGFFSEVFKVTHRTTGQVMVLKMNLLRSNRPNMLKEVQLMNQLSHPNILGFMGVCVHEGQLHALTEYINGGSLEQLNLTRSIVLPHRTRMRLALDIARGVEYLHSRGVFHRDLTSKNVLIKRNEETEEMTAVVGDFGLAAKIPDPTSGYRLPTVGSPYWMSPECLKGQWYDQRSDVFSYGIVLCELIARCEADPDVLPRTENFGLDYLAFADMCGPCPADFLKLAFLCCTFEPKSRPSFADLVLRLSSMLSAPHEGDGADVEEAVTPPATPCKMAAALGARSEELLPGTATAGGQEAREAAQHKKLVHRRSLSDDVGTVVFPPHTAPSDKARCHFLPSRPAPPCPPPLSAQHVGRQMLAQDPHYKPTAGDKANPFAALAQFRGVKKIIGAPGLNPGSFVQGVSGDLFSSCFELPSPFFESGRSRRGGSAGEFDFIARDDTKPLGLCREESEERTDTEPTSETSTASDKRVVTSPRPNNVKPMSLPASPTMARRRLTSNVANVSTNVSPETNETLSPPDTVASFVHTMLDARSCSSHLNLTDVNLIDDVNCFATVLRRRGSCESGFFSSVGEDFGINTNDLLSPDFGIQSRLRAHDASSATLSSSSAASSLFLLDDSATSTATRSGELGEFDDVPGAVGICRPTHHSLLFAAKRSSSIYTDSSEDISSLGGGDLYWEELSRSGAQPQQISKIVEYFERKQSCSKTGVLDADVWDLGGELSLSSSRHHRGMLCRAGCYPPSSPVEFARRMEGASLNEALRSSKIAALRKTLERPTTEGTTVATATASVVTAGGCVKRAVNASQRLMICEGAVKSKLPLFDKKKS